MLLFIVFYRSFVIVSPVRYARVAYYHWCLRPNYLNAHFIRSVLGCYKNRKIVSVVKVRKS